MIDEKFFNWVKEADSYADKKMAIVYKIAGNWFLKGEKLQRNDPDAEFLVKYSFGDAVDCAISDLENHDGSVNDYTETIGWLMEEVTHQIQRMHEIVENDFAEYKQFVTVA